MKRSQAIKKIKESLGGFTPDDEQCTYIRCDGDGYYVKESPSKIKTLINK